MKCACIRLVWPVLLLMTSWGCAAEENASQRGDTQVIEFVYPGQFKKAQEKSLSSNRCLLVKGVAFGVDKQGAVCATKGHW